MKLTYDFSEIENFLGELTEIDTWEAEMTKTVKELAKILRSDIRKWTPVKSGELQSGWKARYKVEQTETGWSVTLENKVPYARWVNYGHRAKNSKDGDLLTVKNRTVKLETRWGQTDTPYYVFGHFFVEKGVLDSEQKTEAVLKKHVEKCWKECLKAYGK